jgi:hypothetical protein
MATVQTRRQRGLVLMMGIATLGTAGCGGGSSPLSGILGIEMTFVPVEVTATASEVEGFEWSVVYQVTLREP